MRGSDLKAPHIALFRGINVGGKNMLPMRDLVRISEENGYTGIETYIQSGNIVFDATPAAAARFARTVGAAIAKTHGFEPGIVVRSAEEFKRAADANPFPKAESAPKSLHLYFLASTPEKPDLPALNRIKAGNESFRLIGDIFYLHAPDGVGRSKLAAQAERLIGVAATARNWSTVTRLLEMAGQRRQ